ncbi:18427_t:CDS:2 [Dentiscutata erythropus]|uniref:18427_t:CDS:1 n=1 Tax=Dentiscutata erythropus TaxID=1348616 RepID=A0A9N9HU36_9GLOM|nr:18427_t:CDS:2 [Dentiscutata erythropus]
MDQKLMRIKYKKNIVVVGSTIISTNLENIMNFMEKQKRKKYLVQQLHKPPWEQTPFFVWETFEAKGWSNNDLPRNKFFL